jgi:hypothetical protein
MHKFHQKVLFFGLLIQMTPYYSIHCVLTDTLHHLSHTCFNQLEFPEYKNSQEMFNFLIDAIKC